MQPRCQQNKQISVQNQISSYSCTCTGKDVSTCGHLKHGLSCKNVQDHHSKKIHLEKQPTADYQDQMNFLQENHLYLVDCSVTRGARSASVSAYIWWMLHVFEVHHIGEIDL